MSDNSTISVDDFTTLARLPSHGSGRGMSFWSDAAACARRATLREDNTADEPVAFASTKPQNFIVGSAYHKLHELWRDGRLSDEVISGGTPSEDASVQLGLHLFRGYAAHWQRNHWGETLSTEEQLPCNASGTAAIVKQFGTDVTARTDLVVQTGKLSESARQGTGGRLGHALQPGRYIVDFKTAGSEYPAEYYTSGLQALWYPLAYNLCYPETPVKGIIFDIILKPRWNAKDQSISLSNFRAYYAPALDASEAAARLHGLVAQGLRNIAALPAGNRAECVKFGITGIQTCPFLGGMCNGA